MNKNNEPTIISKEHYNTKQFYADNKKAKINTTFFINQNGIGISNNFSNIDDNYKKWAEISSELDGNEIGTILNDYKSRTELINTVIEKILQNEIKGIVINFEKSEQTDNTLRFVIEIAPRLRELGISTGIIVNENIKKEKYINSVDYIIE